MKLKRVRIQNYRSIKDASFDVGDLCALIGPNNAGKSNILNALAYLLGDTWPTTRAVDPADFYAYSEDDLVLSVWFDEVRQVKGDVGAPVDFTGIQFKIDRYKKKTGKKQVGDLKSSFLCIDNAGQAVQILKRPNPNAKPYPTPANVTTDIRDELPVVMIDVDRNARYHLSGSSRSIFGRMLADIAKELRDDKDRFKQFEAKFGEARKLLRTPGFEQMESKIGEQLKKHTGLENVTLQLDGLDPINIYKNFSILFQDADTPQVVDSERMGSGVQSALVMSLLQAYREMRKENAVLLFEEPELYLHPHGRRHLFRLLRELAANGVQTVYTTHSQDFLDLSSLESVRMVHKTKVTGSCVIPPDMQKVKGDWRSRVKHLSEPKNEVFFARRVVVVEGATERLAIRRLATMMPTVLELDHCDCSVIESSSKSAVHILVNIMAALGKPVLAIYDTDSDKTAPADIGTNEKWEKEISAAVTAHGKAHAWKCDPCFESEAGMADPRKSDKPERMMEWLDAAGDWNGITKRLQDLMQTVAVFART
ncbi:MAG: AAA family ATPase [Armatimonadetes bacterium]|nr:AAA family ATPase [Armatimonadota bacterium]MDE2205483.1 AAA family ATPase [Armatimonadota bacterium]